MGKLRTIIYPLILSLVHLDMPKAEVYPNEPIAETTSFF